MNQPEAPSAHGEGLRPGGRVPGPRAGGESSPDQTKGPALIPGDGGEWSAGPPDDAAGSSADRATAATHSRLLLGDGPDLTLPQLAGAAEVSPLFARSFWRAMGFADVDDDEARFTRQDADALRAIADLIDSEEDRRPGPDGPGGLSTSAILELLRAQSYTMDRLVLWQLETLVADVGQRLGLDDTSARLVVLDHINEITAPLTDQLTYVWRRHLASLLDRTGAEISRRGVERVGPDYYPLVRSLGFVDIVSFTQRAQTMSRMELSTMLDDFETTARDVITSRGARVVKTIGDAVMYISDDLSIAADVVTSLVEELQSGLDEILVRASLVEGRVVSRSGDVFGPPVNLASRLVDTAEPGGIRMDQATARALMASPVALRYRVRQCHDVVAKGMGNVTPWSLVRA
ncbi:adenylate/guanylate cyclase domain-containing protein [Actinomyces marmotae]|uniref:adenylate/guanylate cyclase domain-containing protein n=1 Tax=Actinomyces TaxID=1654 RepID=UPI0039A64F77